MRGCLVFIKRDYKFVREILRLRRIDRRVLDNRLRD